MGRGEPVRDAAAGVCEPDLTGDELEGSYRLLCCALLQQTARLLAEIGPDGRSVLTTRARRAREKDNSYLREVARQRQAAEGWLDGGGSLSFEECCDELGFRPEQARNALSRFLSACQTAEGRGGRCVTPSRAKSLLEGR